MAFSMASRQVGKADLGLDPAERSAAESARAGWDPSRWTLDQAARTLLILSWPAPDAETLVGRLDRLFAAADVQELVALYQALPLYPFPEAHRLRAAEGIRSNMRAVFESVALRNPYPSEQFDEGPWNQLVLKCLFVGSRLDPVVGLDRRANPTLARMLWDYSRERRAAHRPVSPELWRCVGPFADDAIRAELIRLREEGEPLEKGGAALALRPPGEATVFKDQETWSWTKIADQLDADGA